MTTPLRLTVVCGAGVLGGAELWLTSLLSATDRITVDAVVLADGPVVDQLSKSGVRVEIVPTGSGPASMLRASAVLTRRLRADRPDIVLANGIKAAVVAAPAARAAGVRCAWVKHDHSFDGHPLSWVVNRLVDGVVAASPSLAAASGAADPIVIPPPRPGTPPLPRPAARDALAAAGVPVRTLPLLLAVVGRVVRYKGIEDAVRALTLPGGEQWAVVVIGPTDPSEPDEPARLLQVARALGVEDRVVFTGPLPQAASLLAGVDAVGVLTKPAGYGPQREGFGIVAMEAMVAGVPVVATLGGPVVDRLGGSAGLAVAPGQPSAIAAALGTLADSTTREAMGAAGAALIVDHPGAASCAEGLVRELSRVACRPGAGRTDGPAVSVVTTVLDDGAGVDRLLGLLAGQLTHPDDEIVVVDGGSRDDTTGRVSTWSTTEPRIRLIVEPGAGISAGRNVGIRASRNDLIACTDAGCDPGPGWVDAFRAAAADLGTDHLLTGVYRVTSRGALQTAMAALGYPDPGELRHPGLLSRLYGRLLGRSFDAAMPTGRSMAFGMSVWHKAGGFPEDLQTGEDVLFGRSAVAAGCPAVLVADAEVVWDQRPSIWQTITMYYRYGLGSGRSRDARLLGRDLARLAAYTAAPVLLAVAGLAGVLVVIGAGIAYLSVPLRRVMARRGLTGAGGALRAAALVPAVGAARDLAKVAGALRGLADAWRR